jgi:hypothetical protein
MTVTPVHPDTAEILLCKGLMAYLQGFGLVEYREDQAYGDTFAMAAGFLLSWPAGPDRVLTLTPYPVTDSPDPAEQFSTVGVQARMRWAGANPRAVANYAGAVFDALHGLGPVDLPNRVSISQALRRSGASMGQDANKRWSWADNYYVDMDRVPRPEL